MRRIKNIINDAIHADLPVKVQLINGSIVTGKPKSLYDDTFSLDENCVPGTTFQYFYEHCARVQIIAER